MSVRGGVITIGNFDGVHLGHAAIVRRCRELAAAHNGAPVVAVVFDPHPSGVLRPGTAPARLTEWAHRVELLRAAGADFVEKLEPSPDLLALTPGEFADELVARFGAVAVVEGHDFRFGAGRAGDVEELARLGASRGFRVDTVPTLGVGLSDHSVVPASSSVVRWLISNGRVGDAGAVLGRAYELRGTVVRGQQRGRTIGFPTANVATPQMLPSPGVYGGAAWAGGQWHAAAINSGVRPTVAGTDHRVEVVLLDDDGAPARLELADEYGWPIRVAPMFFVRDEVRFESVAALTAQIGRDCRRIAGEWRVMRAQCPAEIA